MKRKQILAFLLGAVALFCSSCGVSDSVKSLSISSTGSASGNFFNLKGQDGTVQLVVTANYHSGKKIIVTNDSTFSVTPTGVIFRSADPNFADGDPLPPYGPTTVPIGKTGLMTAVASICTWYDLMDTSQNPPVPFDPASWVYTGYYQVTASYKGFTSQPMAIGVGASTSNAPKGGCGP